MVIPIPGQSYYRGSNSSDGGNIGDGVKIAGEVIGSGDEIMGNNLVKRSIVKNIKEENAHHLISDVETVGEKTIVISASSCPCHSVPQLAHLPEIKHAKKGQQLKE
ncbi:hypothetical protein Tco_0163334 [Tanacetum coccineum]